MKKLNFNDRYGLTQAVIEGRKTVTRRVLRGEPLEPTDCIESAGLVGDVIQVIANGGESLITCRPRYKLGETIAVAQSYEKIYHCEGLETIDLVVSGLKHTAGWRNKMFTKAELMPHRIRITRIRVERLQDISDADCLREGIRYLPKIGKFYFEDMRREEGFYFDDHREAFASLIDKVSGRGTWKRNPWVVAYEFELVK